MEKRIEDLYQQYLLGQLSREDFKELQQEVTHTTDDELWNLMCEDFSLSSEFTEMSHETQQRILHGLQSKIRKEQHRKFVHKLLRYASVIAVVVSLLGGGYWGLKSLSRSAPVYTYVNVKAGSKSVITLPDGTHVSLNGNSQLRYNVEPGKHREVVLMKGEAYFDVTKDASCPFRVHVNDMQIEVLGTKFNVKCHSGEVETALFSGAVRLSAKSLPQSYRLSPGRKSIYQSAAHSMEICDNDNGCDGRWKDGYLAFNSKPLNEVLQEIENWYGVSIQLRNKKLADDLLTGAFYHETLESVLYSLSLQYKFKYSVSHGNVVIE